VGWRFFSGSELESACSHHEPESPDCEAGAVNASEVHERANPVINLNATVRIYRPIQQVFEFISTTENDFQWQYGTLESARVPAGAVGVGAYFRSIGHVMGRRLLGTFEITDYEANRKYGFRSLSGPLESQTLYTFEIANGSTTIYVSTQVRVADSFEVHEKVFEKQLRKQLRENLTLLKGLLEAK
jgi:uncharacterized membrane protein